MGAGAADAAATAAGPPLRHCATADRVELEPAGCSRPLSTMSCSKE